jgi:hypothetical protein
MQDHRKGNFPVSAIPSLKKKDVRTLRKTATQTNIRCPTNREHPVLGSRPEVKVLTIVSAQELIMIH